MNNEDLKKLIYKTGDANDKLAFTKIFNYFAPRIMGYLIGSGSRKETAEEITQETLSIVWQKSAQFNYKKGNVSTWIFTIARNKKIDRFRKTENIKYNDLDLFDAYYSKNSEIEDLQQSVSEMQSKITAKEQKIIKMNFFEGKSHKIIAQDLEIPLGTVKSKIRNILIKMKK